MASDSFVGYCMKERQKRPMKDVQVVTTPKGRRMAKGVCTSCGTKMTLFLKSES